VQHEVDRPGNVDELGDVDLDQLKPGLAEQVLDVARRARQEVVETHHFVTIGKQAFTQVGAQKARASGNHDATHTLSLGRDDRGT
jgi:hypothetical protein